MVGPVNKVLVMFDPGIPEEAIVWVFQLCDQEEGHSVFIINSEVNGVVGCLCGTFKSSDPTAGTGDMVQLTFLHIKSVAQRFVSRAWVNEHASHNGQGRVGAQM